MNAVGTRPTYQIFAVATLITGFLYLFFNLTYLSKRPQVEGNDIVKKIPKDKTITENGEISKGMEESKARKEKELENEPYIVEDIEAINNAKNLDIIETMDMQDDEGEKKNIEDGRLSNCVRQRHTKGEINLAFESDGTENCKKSETVNNKN